MPKKPVFLAQFARHPSRTKEKIRHLDSTQLALGTESPPGSDATLDCEITETDKIFQETKSLLDQQYAGVIFTGPPGTSKSWYARQVAALLADRDANRVRFVQFHSSYQYEDFVEGHIPVAGGFELAPKHLLEMCERAEQFQDRLFVIVVDELSRTDPSRVFGEALTYIEMSKRGLKFHLASGTEMSIPRNLVFLCTMNPWDKGVEEVDIALERRFAKIPLVPDEEILKKLLANNGVVAKLQKRILEFFHFASAHRNERARIGHAYFLQVKDQQSLERLWRNQLQFHFERILEIEPDEIKKVKEQWEKAIGEEDQREKK